MALLMISVAVLVSLLTILGSIHYLKEIIQGRVIPTKSTWVIFFWVTSLNVFSFFTVKFDLISGASMVTDFLVACSVLGITLVKFRREKLRFNGFEKYYLLVACGCLIFWLLTSNPFVTNLLAQVLLILGYLSTIHKIIVTRKSGESIASWMIWLSSSVLSLGLAVANHNLLAVIYASRAIVLGGLILLLTCKYSLEAKAEKQVI